MNLHLIKQASSVAMISARQTQQLETEITRELGCIAQDIEEKYASFVPRFTDNFSSSSRRLEVLAKRLEEFSDQLDATQKSDSKTFSNASAIIDELDTVAECRSAIDLMCLIETNLMSMYTDQDQIPIRKAEKLKECVSLMNSFKKTALCGELVDRIRQMLDRGILDMKVVLRRQLLNDFERFLELPEKTTSDIFHMKICTGDRYNTEKVLSAMQCLDLLKEPMKRLADVIVNQFCRALIDARGSAKVVNLIVPKVDEYEFAITKKNFKSKTIDVEATINELKRLFEHLQKAFGGLTVGSDGRSLAGMLGMMIQKDIMTAITKDCLAVAGISATASDAFQQAMTCAEQFREDMIKMEFWNESVPSFAVFSSTNDRLFIDRRCAAILGEARKLICEPFTETEEVGSEKEILDETVQDFTSAFSKKIELKSRADRDKTFPRLLQLLKCKISKSMVNLVVLLEHTLEDGVTAKNELLRERLITTAVNILKLFASIGPKHHEESITTIPFAAAIFYNNCHYLSHRLLMLPFGILKSLDVKSAKFVDLYSDFSREIFSIRTLAVDSFEQTLVNCRRQISTLLSDRQTFVNLNDFDRMTACEKCMKACVSLVQTLSEVWRDILTETVYCHSLGNIVSYLLSDLVLMFLETEDIRSSDSAISADLLEKMLSTFEKMFVLNSDSHSQISSFCERPYFRLKELIHCLRGSLKTIEDRYCDGIGPLTQWMSSTEIRGLVKALFQNTKERKRVLDSII